MIEIEIKLPVKDIAEVEERLRSIGFEEGSKVRETDIYYMGVEHNFRERDEALRIRRIENLRTGTDEAVITFKGPKLDRVSMTRKELETHVLEPEICMQIFESIGMQPVDPVIKTRIEYHRGDMSACLDRVDQLGDYLELEVIAENEGERADALTRMEEILHPLGYGMEDTIRTSYLSMIQNKKNEQE